MAPVTRNVFPDRVVENPEWGKGGRIPSGAHPVSVGQGSDPEFVGAV